MSDRDDLRFATVILAGGQSTRLGRDKVLEPLAGKPMLQHVIDRAVAPRELCVIVRAETGLLPGIRTPQLTVWGVDELPGTGPLGGIYSGLRTAFEDEDVRELYRAKYAMVIACDLPLLQRSLLEELRRLAPEYEAVVPVSDQGLPEPLCAVYSPDCIGPIRERLEAGQLKAASFLEDVHTLLVPPEHWRRFDPGGLSFLNVNREEDLERAREILSPE